MSSETLLITSTLLVCICVVSAVIDDPPTINQHHEKRISQMNPIERAFDSFVRQYNKPYANDLKEYHQRSAVFRNNLAKIERLNRKEQTREFSNAVFGINQFTDMTQAEFKRKRLGLKNVATAVPQSKVKLDFNKLWSELLRQENKTEQELLETMPKSFDWRSFEGTVSKVKDQGNCGSCWSFATTGSIEGQIKLKRNETVSLSEQELVDCDHTDSGCWGGFLETAYEQVIKLGGLVEETNYPYKAQRTSCNITNGARRYTIDGYVDFPRHDEEKMRVWLVKRGPITIGIDSEKLPNYKSGVLHPTNGECQGHLDHATLIVGYGEETIKNKTLPYWIIKNSWSDKWGEAGYYRIFRGENTCGLASKPSSAVII